MNVITYVIIMKIYVKILILIFYYSCILKSSKLRVSCFCGPVGFPAYIQYHSPAIDNLLII